MTDKPTYAKSLPAIDETEGVPSSGEWHSELADLAAKRMAEPLNSLTGSAAQGMVLVKFPGGHTAIVPETAVVSLDTVTVDPVYDDLFLDGQEEHHSGCSSSRDRACTCEYLGQWK